VIRGDEVDGVMFCETLGKGPVNIVAKDRWLEPRVAEELHKTAEAIKPYKATSPNHLTQKAIRSRMSRMYWNVDRRCVTHGWASTGRENCFVNAIRPIPYAWFAILSRVGPQKKRGFQIIS
jgi:hypothetical protein